MSAAERAFALAMAVHHKDVDPRTGKLFRESQNIKEGFLAGWRARGAADAETARMFYGGPAHTYASENADVYRAGDNTCWGIADAIARLDETEGEKHGA